MSISVPVSPSHHRVTAHPAPLSRRVLHQGLWETAAILRNGEQLTVAIVLPLLVLVALVLTPVLDSSTTSRVDLATPGVLALCSMSTALTGQGIATGFDRRYGVLRYFSTTPLGRVGLLAGKFVAILVVLALQVSIVSVVGLVLGWRPTATGVVVSVPILLLGTVAFAALGFLIAGTARPEATLALLNLLWVLLGALGGVAVPTSTLPGFLQNLAHFLPSGTFGDGLRAALIEGRIDLWAVSILLVWSVVASIAAGKWFKWT